MNNKLFNLNPILYVRLWVGTDGIRVDELRLFEKASRSNPQTIIKAPLHSEAYIILIQKHYEFYSEQM